MGLVPLRHSSSESRFIVMPHAAPTRFKVITTKLHQSEMPKSIAQTATFNVAATLAAGLGGVIIARVLGPVGRGEYAAITAWFGVAVIIGQFGQPAALCFYVARDPISAREYVATSRTMLLLTGTVILTLGLLLAPILSHGRHGITIGYQIAFATLIISLIGVSYTFPLQAQHLHRWNLVKASQPVPSLIGIIVLWRLRLLTLNSALIVLAVSTLLQLGYAYISCRKFGLAPGRTCMKLVRPLAKYGSTQLAASTSATLNLQLDQLVLSQLVPPADLGRYAIAASLTLLPLPLVSAIGNVAFPNLAAKRIALSRANRLQRIAVIGAAGLTTGMLLPLAAAANWLVPFIFGAAYRGAVPLIWILIPGSIFLTSGQVAGDLLRGRNRPAAVAWAQGLGAVSTVLMLIALLPIIGIYGAAVASTVAYGITLVFLLRALSRLSSSDQ